MKHITKRYIAELVLLSSITEEMRLTAVKIVKTIKGYAWIITRRFNKYRWSKKEIAAIKNVANKERARYSVLGMNKNIENALASLSANFNEGLYLGLIAVGVL